MQATINSNFVGSNNQTQENISSKLDYLLADVNSKTKNDIENSIVAMGARVVNCLVEKLKILKGIQRGVVAMSLIRIGESSVVPLKALACEKSEYQWMADYLLNEI